MNRTIHTVYIVVMVIIVVAVTVYLSYTGYDYYTTPLEEKFYHPNHAWFKPSGPFGHGLGIFGTLMILIGVSIYIARKRYNFLTKYIRLKYLLEFHIFLCSLGPVLILFHTAFKFGGIVSVAFWSMVVVVASGVIGRFIYIQIPRTIEGRELNLNEVKEMKAGITNELKTTAGLDEEAMSIFFKSSEAAKPSLMNNRKTIRAIKKILRKKNIARGDRIKIITMVKNELSLSRKIGRLQMMQKIFKYWHVAHLPFALIMLIILIVHVAVTLIFGYKWIF